MQTFLKAPFESRTFSQTPHQQQVTVRIVGAEPLSVFLKETFTSRVIAAAV